MPKNFPLPLATLQEPVLSCLSGHLYPIVLKPFDLSQVCHGNKICSKLALTGKLTLELAFPAHCISNWNLNGISTTNISKVTLNAANDGARCRQGWWCAMDIFPSQTSYGVSFMRSSKDMIVMYRKCTVYSWQTLIVHCGCYTSLCMHHYQEAIRPLDGHAGSVERLVCRSIRPQHSGLQQLVCPLIRELA